MSKAINLRLCLNTLNISCGINKHAQTVMNELGINYIESTPQSMGDQWWFWGCTNVPEALPEYLTELKADPAKWVDSVKMEALANLQDGGE